MNWKEYSEDIAKKAFASKRLIKNLTSDFKNKVLYQLADEIIKQKEAIITENQKDLEEGKNTNLSSSFMDRLLLNEKRIEGMAKSIRDIASLPDPIGEVTRGVTLNNGLELITKKVPIGVLMVIYESRPNVTLDVSTLCFKSGNACILRGGKEAIYSNRILASIFKEILIKNNLPEDAVVFVDETDRSVMSELLQLDQYIDIVVPRGGEGLIKAVSSQARMSVVKHDKGVVNLFVDESADLEDTLKIVINSKVQRPSVCNALENLVIHKNYPYKLELLNELAKNDVDLFLDTFLISIYPKAQPATAELYSLEFTDLRLSCIQVDSLDEAIQFINRYSSGHTECILTKNIESIDRFNSEIDSAGIFVNCSTRFHDGGEFGLGAEVGISTGKLHVRGPMGLEHLTTTTSYLMGKGHVRT
ncbi:MAG: glutamate-5-semialdehyde dehydrogenase [Leptospira sp.]|nr:glutamate-5-semialdehyde dehydrogenase [Leptospira sp.]